MVHFPYPPLRKPDLVPAGTKHPQDQMARKSVASNDFCMLTTYARRTPSNFVIAHIAVNHQPV